MRCNGRIGQRPSAGSRVSEQRLRQGAFELEQSPLGLELVPGQPARIPAESATGDDSVTGDDDRDRIEPHDPADGTRGDSGAAAFSKLTVVEGFSVGDGVCECGEDRTCNLGELAEVDRQGELMRLP